MNQMMLYAKCVVIRDQQLSEKARLKEEEKERNRKLDAEMEAHRVGMAEGVITVEFTLLRQQKQIQLIEEREKQRRKERKLGKAVIIRQMKDREQQRLREREAKEQAAAASVAAMKIREEREQEERKKKAQAGRMLLNEILKVWW